MRADPRTHIRPAAHTHAHIHIYTHIHTYARIRAREGNFLTPNLLYSITKPSSIISPTAITSIIQSLYNPYPYWHHHRYIICTKHQNLSSSTIHYHPFGTIFQLSTNHLTSISYSSPIHYHYRPSSYTYSIFIQFPV